MLLTQEQKEKILNSKLDNKTIKLLEEFFEKHEEKEKLIWTKISKSFTNIALKIILALEEKEREQTLKELEQIEQKLK